jgi:hypothetical protein
MPVTETADMRDQRHLAATWLAAASLLLAPVPALADGGLSGKRATCQSDARRQIKSRAGYGASLYGVTMDARGKFVRDCMARVRADSVTSGSVAPIPAAPVEPQKGTAPVGTIRTR